MNAGLGPLGPRRPQQEGGRISCVGGANSVIKSRGVTFIGSDDALDVTPSLVEGMNLPVHTLMITALGINLLDNQDLETVAETAARLNRWEFMLTVAPVLGRERAEKHGVPRRTQLGLDSSRTRLGVGTRSGKGEGEKESETRGDER